MLAGHQRTIFIMFTLEGLPTWEDVREQLRLHGVTDLEVAEHVWHSRAIGSGSERLVLYQLLESVLASPVAPPAIPVD